MHERHLHCSRVIGQSLWDCFIDELWFGYNGHR
jgi:hypothetical protein